MIEQLNSLFILSSTYTKSLALLPLIKLGHHSIFLSQSLIKKHGIIIDIANDNLVLYLGNYIYTGASSAIILGQTSLPRKSIFAKTQQDIISYKIIKKDA